MKKLFMSSMIVLFCMSTYTEEIPVLTSPIMDQSNNIRHYLMREASNITDNAFAGLTSLSEWERQRPQWYENFVEMLSLTDVPLRAERPPLNVKIVGEIPQDGFKIVKLYYESLPNLYVPADLYIPDGITNPVPAVLYVCGHSRTQKVHYQTHPRKLAQLGFVSLIIETIQWGEVQGSHWGCYSEGQFQWYSRGYTPGGVETWNSIRGLDLLSSLPEVDPERLGVTGISGGGAYTWYLAAIDPRIKAAAAVCGTGTMRSQIHQRLLDGHCDCMMHINTYGLDYNSIGALIAPRPLLIASANGDGLYSVESIRESYEQIKKIYDLYGATDNIDLIETPGGHSYHESSRTLIFSFLLKHLMDKDVPPSEVGDIELDSEKLLSVDELRIFKDGPLPDDRTLTIQNEFVKLANPPKIANQNELQKYREDVLAFLQEKTFHAFPEKKTGLDVKLEFRAEDNGKHVYSFVPEEDFRLKVQYHKLGDPQEKRPVLLVLRSPNEKRWESDGFTSGLDSGWDKAYLEVRGVGEAGWSPEMQWHVRRAAAWTGRTLASMRVYDVLRCIEALRSLDHVDPDRIALGARGEMAAIALYAALLDGKLNALLINNPPATQDAPSAEDGRGEAIEMLNCLRITDLPQVAGILQPTKVHFVGEPHENYQWALKTAETVGMKDNVTVVQNIRSWKP